MRGLSQPSFFSLFGKVSVSFFLSKYWNVLQRKNRDFPNDECVSAQDKKMTYVGSDVDKNNSSGVSALACDKISLPVQY